MFNTYKWLNKFLYKNEQLVSVSKEITEKFRKKYNFSSITTIHNGFDFKSIYEKSIEFVPQLNQQYILFYGRIDDEQKNLKLLLNAYLKSNLPKAKIELLLLGRRN